MAYPTSFEDALSEIDRLRKVERAAAVWLREHEAGNDYDSYAATDLSTALVALGVKPAEAP